MEFKDYKIYKNEFGIYKITNNINNKVYIGQTRQRFCKRFWHHSWKLRNNNHDNQYLQNAWNHYGEDNFTFSIVEVLNDVEKLNIFEKKYISELKSIDKCYNMQDGGQTYKGFTRTEEHRKSIGEKNRLNMLGRKHSEETKKKMSESRKGNQYNKKKFKISDKNAMLAKEMLMNGIKPSSVAKDLNVPYKVINGIISSNSYKHVLVEGWEEFLKGRKKYKRTTLEECFKIYKLHTEDNISIKELAIIYGISEFKVNNSIKRARESFDNI